MKEKNKKNKVKGLIQLIIIAIIILLFLVFCGKNEGFTVTFNIDGKEYHEISDIKQGNTIEEPKDPEKEGYSFAGWFLNDKEFNFDKPINKNIKLDAKWNINEYTVTINTGTGSIINERVNYNGTIDKPVAPSKEGYIFVGWYSNDEIFDFNTKVNSDLNIEARWSNQIYSTYKVEHYLMNKNGKYIDTPEETQTLTGKIGSVVTPSTKEYKGYTTPEIQEITVSADGKATVRYYYSINKYKLTLKGDDGVKSITGDGEYFYNDKVDINYIIKDGYSLVNISEKLKDNAYTMEDKDVVIEITTEQNKDTKYVVKHYKMNIKGKYSTTASETEELYGVTDTSVTPSVKTYVGFTSPETTTVNVDGDGKTVVKYYYERNKYELTLGKDKGIESLIGAGKYYFEQEVNIKANIKDGYTFKAWSNDQKDTEFVYKIPAQNTSINASTTVNIYTIFYNLNNGEATNVSKYTVEDEIVLNDATKTGYTFTGWTGDKVVNGKVVQGTTGDLEITANFIANTYKIILDKNSGEGQDQIVQTAYDKTTILPLNTYTKLGYTFIGWSTEKDNTVEYSNEADVTNISTGSDVTLYAVWQINTYTITYNLNNGIATNTSTYTVEEEITLNDATKTGYTFTGWTGDKVVNGVISKGTTGDLEITANYKVIIYNITYNLDNGIATNVGTYTVEDEIILNDATKTGYTFTGWTGDKVVNGVISKGTIGDLEITANYIANEYLITYDANGGNVTPGNKTVIYDSVYGELATPTREGYTFEGWYLGDTKVTNTTEVKTAEAHTLVAKWTANEYLVTYDANGGTVALGSKTVTYDGAYGELATPTREGYTFEGWYLGDTKVTSTIEVKTAEAHTLVANWIANEYLVTYDANGGTVATGSKTVIYDSTYGELATPTREGYTFEGWYLGSVEVSSATEVKTAENHTLIANWTANEYLVTYDANGGTVTPGSKTVAYDSEYGELATPVKTGYTFEGWYLGAVQVTSATQVTTANAHTLVARWIANTYRITLDKNSGEGQDQIVQTAYYKNTTLPLNIYTKLGYTFIGWSTEKDNTVEYFDQADVTNISTGEDVTLYAVWQINTYTIMYNLNNGIATNVGTYTVEDEITLNDATKTGYTFVGWIGDKVVNGVIPKGTTGDLEITANYEVIIYNITYNLDNGEATNVKNYTVEDEITLNDATKTGYTFTGWTGDGVVNGVISKGTIGDLEITANYIANEYLVTYDANGGTVTPENKTVTYDSVYGELAIPERTGYTFEGWYLGNVEITSTTQVTTAETHTLVAKWSANQYLVTYDTNGGTVISGNKTVTYDGAYGELATPTREGYTFEGWYLGTDQVTSATEVKTAETHTLIAKWKINKYTVIFNSNGGTSIESIEVYYNGVINRPVEDPIRIGHTFVGWYLEGTEFDFSSLMPANNITLKAKWNVNSSTIGFDTNGGSIVDAIIQDYGTSVSAPQDPTRDGYTFRGWYSDEDLNEEYEFTTMPAEGITVYAKWTANQYLVTYDANGGTVTPGNKTVIYDSEYGELAIPERTGYTFEGWYLGNAKVTSTTKVKTAENHTLIAKWQINTYNITYNLDNGIATNVSTYTVEEEITLNDATKTGYTFTGWTGDNVVNGVISKGTTGDLEITANYEVIIYNITYNLDNGIATNADTYTVEDEITLKDATKTGYTFTGWTGDNVVNGVISKGTTGDLEITANYTANEYLVTYDANGGNVTPGNKTATYDGAYGELAIPERTGYTFEGWYLENAKVTSTTQVTTAENHTLVANWTANTYKIILDKNSGEGQDQIVQTAYDKTTILPLNTYTKLGYTFIGWSTEKDNTVEYSNEADVTNISTGEDVTLYAVWQINTYTIMYNLNNGIATNVGTYTVEEEITLNDATKTGYTFTGWTGDKVVNGVIPKGTTGDLEITANYEVIIYNITYNLDNGEATNADTYTVEDEITLNDATKTGYTFTGWTGDKVVNGVISKGTTGDLEITANYTANEYLVAYDANGGTVTPGSKTVIYDSEYGELAIPERTGYTFEGWYLGNAKVTSTTQVKTAENHTLIAKWQINTYNITYNLDNGIATNVSTYTVEEEITLNDATKTGYTFTGWTGDKVANGVIPKGTTGDLEITANYEVIIYNITYNLDNGIATNVGTYTVEDEIILNDATKTGYTFTGWTGDNVVNGVISKGTTGDLEITANYTANEYLITYDSNGGTVTPGNKTATYDGAYGELAIPERTGYTFEGWYLENAKVTSTTQVTTAENHTLVANWTANEYLVTYDANGGSVTSTNKTITYDSMYGELATPTREGYTFEGWYLGDTKVTSTTQVTTTENHTLVANWTANEYLVTYDANGGNVTPENKTVIYDSEYGELAIPERTGYTFEGWYLENDKVIGTTQVQTADNHTLIANWTANTYKIILDKNSGEGQDQIVQTAYDKTTILPLNIYTKSGYTFIGWSTEQNNTVEYFEQSDVTNISTGSDVTLYAVWQINTYNITYNLNNGIATNVGTYTVEEEITLNDATKTGYTFTGWTGDKVVNGVILKGTTGDLEITANFTANSYKIILKSNNGSEQTQVVQTAYDKTTILPANIFTKAGYSFAGWSTTSDGIAQYDNEANVTNISEGNDVELYAIWKANTYEIKYNANGGNGTMSSTSATYDKEVQLSSNTYTRTGYSFAGWSTSKDNTVEYLNNQKVTNLVDSGTTTLYAIWNLETYTITYNLDGGTIGGTNPTTYTYESNDITLIKPTREDYVFAGWSINGTLDKEGIIEKGTTGNLEIVAQWRIKPLIESVSFDLFKADENGSYENYYADGKNHSIYMGNKAFYLKLPKDSSLDIYTLSIALNTGVILNVDSEDIVDNYADITATESSGTGYTGTIDLNLDIPMLPSTMKLKSSDKGLTWKSTSTGGMKVSTVEFTGLLSKYNKRLALAEGLGITNDEYELETPRYLSNYETIGGNVFMFFGVADSTNTKMTTKKVTFVNVSNNQVNAIDPIYVPVGSQIPDVGEVRIAGYKWIGWYSDPELTKPLDFSTLVYDNLTVYGKYEKLPVEESWYYDSEGTMDDPYKLCGPQQLLSFASFVEADTNKFANKHVKLTCSADMTGVEWIPISTFRGTFDGGEYTISNLTINDSAGVYEHIGFFDTLHNATVRNLKFKNVTINSTQSSASGALTAVMDNSTVERVAVDGVTITGSDYIGGLIGQISDLTGDKLADGTEDKVSVAIVKEISVKNGSVTANGYDVGGVIGAAANTVTISDLYSDVSVRSKGSGKPADTGGILGNYWGSDAGFKMERVIFTGSVKVSSEKFIMFGNNSSGAIYGRVGTGAIDGLTPNDSFVSDSEKITLLYKSSGIGLSKSHSLARGTGKSESALKNKSNYDTTIWSNWTFDNSANSYPTLTWLVG